MRPSFHPQLINDPFSDPGLFIPFLFERRALLFDLGDVSGVSSRDLLKVSHVFVTHTHMDHFIGFDSLIRLFLGREKILHLFGPPDFFEQVEGHLGGYTWNLVNEYEKDFTLQVHEVRPEETVTQTYSCRDGFRRGLLTVSKPFHGPLLEESHFSVEGVLLDHRIPCLGLSIVEKFYVNIIKEGLKELELPVGPWLTRFKAAIYRQEDLQSDFPVTWEEKGKIIKEKRFVLDELVRKIARISPGQKITYITDVAASTENRIKIIELAAGSDLLYIEAAFLQSEKDAAQKKYHLTAREAGKIAASAGVRRLELFHFSPRYRNQAGAIRKEAMEGFTPNSTVETSSKTKEG